jgi:hypothetical protein
MLRGLVQQKILVNRNPNSTENNLKEAFFFFWRSGNATITSSVGLFSILVSEV